MHTPWRIVGSTGRGPRLHSQNTVPASDHHPAITQVTGRGRAVRHPTVAHWALVAGGRSDQISALARKDHENLRSCDHLLHSVPTHYLEGCSSHEGVVTGAAHRGSGLPTPDHLASATVGLQARPEVHHLIDQTHAGGTRSSSTPSDVWAICVNDGVRHASNRSAAGHHTPPPTAIQIQTYEPARAHLGFFGTKVPSLA